ncbi:MAG: hypothetical protein FWD09_02320 [Lentimicrobiaceae bacterium]|nr:hypothetical protein [Lentimicrobiaceae bacterium]
MNYYFDALINTYLKLRLREIYCVLDKYIFSILLYKLTVDNTIEEIDVSFWIGVATDLRPEKPVHYLLLPRLEEEVEKIKILIAPKISLESLKFLIKNNDNQIYCVFYEDLDISEKDREYIQTRIMLISKKDVDNTFEELYGKLDTEKDCMLELMEYGSEGCAD